MTLWIPRYGPSLMHPSATTAYCKRCNDPHWPTCTPDGLNSVFLFDTPIAPCPLQRRKDCQRRSLVRRRCHRLFSSWTIHLVWPGALEEKYWFSRLQNPMNLTHKHPVSLIPTSWPNAEKNWKSFTFSVTKVHVWRGGQCATKNARHLKYIKANRRPSINKQCAATHPTRPRQFFVSSQL